MKEKEERFIKVVEYCYPNGEIFEGGVIWFYFMIFIIWILYSIFCLFTFPFRFFWSDFKGKRKIYWKKIKSRSPKHKQKKVSK
jgi:hypothetical protein